MYRKILVGYDASDPARDALALGKQLSDVTGAELVVAGVFSYDPVWGGYDARFREADVDFARAIEAAAAEAGAEAEAFPSSSPARGLHELGEEIGADLILVGSARHGRLGQILAGSTGIGLLHGTPCAVGIAPLGYGSRQSDGIATVAVGFDGSPESAEALATGVALAGATGAKLNLVSAAVPPPVGRGKAGGQGWHELTEVVVEERRRQLEEVRSTVPAGIDVKTTLITGAAVDALADVGSEAGTLLVVGSRGYGPLRRVLLGSVSSTLVRSAPCPLIVMPRGMHESAEEKRDEAVEAAS